MIFSFSRQFVRQNVAGFAALVVLLFAYTALSAVYLNQRTAISNIDFWYHISLGVTLRWGDPATLVNGLYPLGYPFLLDAATRLGIDALRFGQFLSWSGGLLLLASAFSLVYLLTRNLVFAIAGTVLLLLNLQFLTYATIEGNDMLAAGLQAASAVALWYATTRGPETFSKPFLVIHGILLGLAYLTRYTGLLLLPISLVFLVVLYRPSPRNLLGALALALGAFVLTASVQLIPSWIVYKNLFYNEQAKNVWFGIYGQLDWVNNWGKVPDSIGLTQVIAMDPARFFQHWLLQLRSAFVSDQLWQQPFHLAWLMALPVLTLSRQLSSSRRLLLLMLILIPFGFTALAWLAPRFLLLSLWTEAILIAWLAFWLNDLIPWDKRIGVGMAGGGLLLAAIFVQWGPASNWLFAPPMTRPREVNQFLRLVGMTDAGQVATNDPYLHAVDVPLRTRYEQIYWVNSNPTQVEDLFFHPVMDSWRYLVVDYQNGFGEYGAIRHGLREAKSLLVPLAFSDQRDIFCITPCTSDEETNLHLTFDNGMQLVDFRWHKLDRERALTLTWQADHALNRSYKVSVRVLNTSGTEMVQIDNIPQLWTFPTTAWSPQTPVVDFYSWSTDDSCEACTLSLMVYDEATLAPVLATTEDGSQLGPLIDLGSLSESRR